MIRDNLYLDPNCKLYLPLRDLDGDNITDRTAHGLVAANNGSVYGMQGRDFDGVDQYIDCGVAVQLKISEQGTFVAWAKSKEAGTDYGQIFCKDSALNVQFFFYSDTRVYFQVRDSLGNAHVVLHNTDYKEWRHIAGTYDGKVQRIYIDGKMESESTWSGTIRTADERWLIGARDLGGGAEDDYLKGIIGEVAIYNRALTQAEIDRIYQITREDYV